MLPLKPSKTVEIEKKALHLYARLASGDTEGFKSAFAMMNRIMRILENNDISLAMLDPSGQTSAEQMTTHLQFITSHLVVLETHKLATKLKENDLNGYETREALRKDINLGLRRAGQLNPALQPR